MTPLAAWVLGFMLLLQPRAPWRATYENTAAAIAKGAELAPVFDGDDGVARTAALDAAIAWFESRFDPRALGDHGRSHGLYQVQGHGELEDPLDQTILANAMIRSSFDVCRKHPLEERLGWYAAGGNDCERGLRESRNRIGLAMRLFKKHPPPTPKGS